MKIAVKYKKYRKASKELNGKISETTFNKMRLDDAVNLLGFDRQGQTIIFDDEFEMDVMTDFMMFESVDGEKRPCEMYKMKYPVKSKMEEEILEALILSRTSLFKIESVDEENNVVWLSDILNGKQNIRLVDIQLSMNAKAGFLMFTRLISFEDFCMTSGVSFVFNPDVKDYVLRRHKKIMKKYRNKNESLGKFIAFFKLSKECGIEVMNA